MRMRPADSHHAGTLESERSSGEESWKAELCGGKWF